MPSSRRLTAVLLAFVACALPVAPARAAAFPDAEAILTDLGKAAGGAVVEGGLGLFLSQYGLGNATAADLSAVNAKLDQIVGRLDALEAGQAALSRAIDASDYKAALRATDAPIARIEADYRDFKDIMTLTDATMRANRTRLLLTNIGQYVPTALITLQKAISGSGGERGLIPASSYVIRSKHRFFRHAQATQARSVWHYLLHAEVMALELLTEYRTSQPTLYTTEQAQKFVADEAATVRSQRNMLKPLLPEGLAVDTHTGLAWEFSGVNKPTLWYASFPQHKVAMIDRELGIARYLYTHVPQRDHLPGLLAGHTGDPIDWLHTEAGFPKPMTPGNIGFMVWSKSAHHKESCSDIFNYFNCRQIPYATAVVIRRQCSSDPDGTVCDPYPGHYYDVQLGQGATAGIAQILFEPQDHWYYGAG